MFINGEIAVLVTKIEDYSVVVYSNDFGVDKRLSKKERKNNLKIGGVKIMKKFIRKVAAVGAGTAMLLGSIGGALASGETLAYLPAPFVVNSAYADVAMVVGADAGTNDNAARTALKTYFDGEATAVAGDVGISDDAYSREFYYEVDFNDTTAFGKDIDDEKISTLLDSKVDWGDKSYDVRELINFTTGAEVSTSGNTTGLKELGGDPYLTFSAGSVSYLYKFDDAFNESDTSSQNLSTSTPLEFGFLGKDIEITDISTTENTITIKLSDDYPFREGESQTVNGDTFTVGSIFETSVEVTFGDNTVKVDTIGYNSNNPDLSKVILNIGSKVTDTVSDGEVFELFEDYDPDNDAPWEWEIDTKGGNMIRHLGITLRLAADDLDITDSDANPDPIAVGESLVLPNDYIAISFDSTTDTSYCKMTIENKEDYDLNTSASGGSNGDNSNVFIFSGSENNCFAIGGTDTDRVYAKGNNNNVTHQWDLWYDDSEGIKKNYTGGSTFNIDWDDTIMAVSFVNDTGYGAGGTSGSGQYIKIARDSNADTTKTQHIFLNVTSGFEEFGTTDDYDSGKYEVFYAADNTTSTPSVDFSGRDYRVIDIYGVIIGDEGSNVEDDLDADRVVISVPNNRAQAVVSIAAGSQVIGGAVVEAALTTESGAAGYNNLILVGGPCVNSLTADYLGVPYKSCEGASGITENKGLVKLVEKSGKTALIVAGWEKEHTKKAADAVAAGGLTGTEYIVE
jgi:hypothetical protein